MRVGATSDPAGLINREAATARCRARLCIHHRNKEDRREIGASVVKRPGSIVEDFESIYRYLNRLENERARHLLVRAVTIEEGKSEDRTSISQLWIDGKV